MQHHHTPAVVINTAPMAITVMIAMRAPCESDFALSRASSSVTTKESVGYSATGGPSVASTSGGGIGWMRTISKDGGGGAARVGSYSSGEGAGRGCNKSLNAFSICSIGLGEGEGGFGAGGGGDILTTVGAGGGGGGDSGGGGLLTGGGGGGEETTPATSSSGPSNALT